MVPKMWFLEIWKILKALPRYFNLGGDRIVDQLPRNLSMPDKSEPAILKR